MTAPATPAEADVTRWAVKCGKCAVEQHANGRCPDACPICGAVHPAWSAPATPAPADGAPGERVSVDAAAVADLQRMLNSWWANVGHDLGGPQTAELYAALRTIAATAAQVRPSREAVEAAVGTLIENARYAGELNTGPEISFVEVARAALLALVFGDSAPGEVDRGE